MGRHSSQKCEYDLFAAECFESRGYEVEFVSGRLADLVGWKPAIREFAIIEVKSPREKNAPLHFQSEKSYLDVKGMSRATVQKLIEKQDFAIESAGMARLVAFTVTNQLYTYWLKKDGHLKKLQTKRREVVSPTQFKAFLACRSSQTHSRTGFFNSFSTVN